MTGEDGGGERLVIRFDNGETLSSPDGWPEPTQAKQGEAPLEWMDRAVDEDPFVRSIIARGGLRPLVPPQGLRPGELTVAGWKKAWPEKRGDPVPAIRWMFSKDYHRLLGYELERAAQRVRVAACDRLRVGNPAMEGRTGPMQSIESVSCGLFHNPDMELQRDGGFRPVPRRGEPLPPSDLPVFGALTLRPAGDAVSGPKPVPDPPLRAAGVTVQSASREEGSVPIIPPGFPPELAQNPIAVEAFFAMWRYAETMVKQHKKPPTRDVTAQEANRVTDFPVRQGRGLYRYLPIHLRNVARSRSS